jgi:hypothetical protein
VTGFDTPPTSWDGLRCGLEVALGDFPRTHNDFRGAQGDLLSLGFRARSRWAEAGGTRRNVDSYLLELLREEIIERHESRPRRRTRSGGGRFTE